MNLLSVDWDYFFPSGEKTDKWALWDWGHSEKHGGELLQVLWQSRAVGFRHYGLDLPTTSGTSPADILSRNTYLLYTVEDMCIVHTCYT